MKKMWAGRTAGETDHFADDFNSSIRFDQRLYEQDIRGSIAHAEMLSAQKIIPEAAKNHIVAGLEDILSDLQEGVLEVDPSAEDIHMFIEQVLTERIGEEGKMLHTARSRNDQVALDLRLYLKAEIDEILFRLRRLLRVIVDQAEKEKNTILPGYTHLQRAQPVLFGHHLMAYAMMLDRDISRLEDTRKRTDVSVIGSCALAGTTYDTDRGLEASLLGLSRVGENSMDGVSDRDFAAEFLFDCSVLMMHLSRFSEEILLWTSWEFGFVELDDRYTTGSSIMPQKKNSDMAELVRGKTGRVYGDLMTLLTVLKGLPLAYNKDMQEDKEPVFDAVDTITMCLDVFTPMIATMKVRRENMKKAAQKGFINATDLADYLTRKGMPFRDAYKISGKMVSWCMEHGTVLEEVSLDRYREFSALFDEDVYDAIDLENCVNRRISEGGTSASSVERQIALIRKKYEGDV